MQSNSSNKNSGINSSENKGHSLAAERRAKLAKLRQALSLQDRDITSAPSLTKVDEFQERYGAADKRNGLVNEPDTLINDGTHKIFYNETQVNGREERNRKYTDTGSILTEDTDFEDESSPPSSPSRGTSASTLSARTAIIKSPASDSTDSSGRVGSSTVKVYQNGQYINSMEDLGYQSSISSPNDKRYSPQESKKMSLLKVERSVDTFSQSLPETFFKTVKLDLSQSVGLPSGDAITKSKVLYDPRIFRKDCATVDQIPELDIGDDETEKEFNYPLQITHHLDK